MSKQHAVVTGGAGFIGSHLCRALLEKGLNVMAVDNFHTGSKKNVEDLSNNPAFTLMEHDVTKPFTVEGINYVYSLASPASPVDYQEAPLETLRTNALGTEHALALALKEKARFLLASTSEIYGDPEEHPQRESYMGHVNPVGPRACYDEAKRYAEALTATYRDKLGADVRIARIFNTYGPSMRFNDGRVVPNFIVQALKNEPLTVYGKGTQTRSFCYVSDLVEGLICLMESDYQDPVNLGNPNEKSILEFAKLIKQAAGSSSEIVFEPLPEDDPLRRRPDISLAKKELGWEPKVSLAEGMQKTMQWFKENI